MRVPDPVAENLAAIENLAYNLLIESWRAAVPRRVFIARMIRVSRSLRPFNPLHSDDVGRSVRGGTVGGRADGSGGGGGGGGSGHIISEVSVFSERDGIFGCGSHDLLLTLVAAR